MIIEEKKVEVVKNPYSWPKSYYMETDAWERFKLLQEQMDSDKLTDGKMAEDEQVKNQLRLDLWKKRYQKKGKDYIDHFLHGLMGLQYVSGNLNASFQKKHNQKESLRCLKEMGLNKSDLYTEDLLFAELKHLIMIYALTCMDDRKYGAVFWGFGKIEDDKLKAKIRNDIESLICLVPQELNLQTEFSLLTQAGLEAMTELGL